jgi:hypothetical protein
MNNIEYWFDAKKEKDVSKIRQKFKDMMYSGSNLTTTGLDVFNTIWTNTSLRESLFPQPPGSSIPQWKVNAQQNFILMINTLDNNFFKFINVI